MLKCLYFRQTHLNDILNRQMNRQPANKWATESVSDLQTHQSWVWDIVLLSRPPYYIVYWQLILRFVFFGSDKHILNTLWKGIWKGNRQENQQLVKSGLQTAQSKVLALIWFQNNMIYSQYELAFMFRFYGSEKKFLNHIVNRHLNMPPTTESASVKKRASEHPNER